MTTATIQPSEYPGGQYNATPPLLTDQQTSAFQVDSAGNLKITTGGGGTGGITVIGTQVTYTDRSGTVTLGGSAQTIMASNASRRGFIVQNQSSGDLWISSLGAAAATQPSIWLPAGAYYEPPFTGVPTAAISLFGATTGQAFAAREW